jgi:hypothetical protein
VTFLRFVSSGMEILLSCSGEAASALSGSRRASRPPT